MEEESLGDLGSGQMGNDVSTEAYINPTLVVFTECVVFFVFTLGVIGNLYVILTVWCRKEMSSTTNCSS